MSAAEVSTLVQKADHRADPRSEHAEVDGSQRLAVTANINVDDTS